VVTDPAVEAPATVAREELTVPGGDGSPRPAYLYWPEHPSGATCVLVEASTDRAGRLCAELQCVVLSVPARAIEDRVAALEWARENVPGRPFYVGGSGAAQACARLREAGTPLPDLQLVGEL